jgi:putative ATP-binding cassette transporter
MRVLCYLSCCVLQALLASGTTVISVGHRPTLIPYHRQVLQLASNQGGVPGKWKVLPAEQMTASANELV